VQDPSSGSAGSKMYAFPAAAHGITRKVTSIATESIIENFMVWTADSLGNGRG